MCSRVCGFVLDVGHRDGDAARLFLGCIIDGIEAPELHLGIVLGQHLGDRRRQGGLAVIDVPDRPDVHVRLAALEFLLGHFVFCSSVKFICYLENLLLTTHLPDNFFAEAARHFRIM